MNELYFFSHFFLVIISLAVALKIGKFALNGVFIVLITLANLFILKQVGLFGLTVTAVEPYAIGAMLTMGLLQEYFGKQAAEETIKSMLFILVFLWIMGLYQVLYIPHPVDTFHDHYFAILSPSPRIFLTSIVVAVSMQYANIYFLRKSKGWFPNIPFAIRQTVILLVVQFFDTVLFSFAALYGIMHNLTHVIFMSYTIKIITIACMGPLLALFKRLRTQHV